MNSARSRLAALLAGGPLLLLTTACTPDAPEGVLAPGDFAGPADLEATASAPSRVDLTWSPLEGFPEDTLEYQVYRDGNRIAAVDSVSFSDTGLSPLTSYEYAVSAVVNGTESERSASVQVTTADDPPSRPGEPESTEIEADRIAIAWVAATDPTSGVEEYVVYRRNLEPEEDDPDSESDSREIGRTEDTTFVDEDLRPFNRYEYRVSAVNGSEIESEPSDPAEFRTRDPSPPTEPRDLEEEDEGSVPVELVWEPAEDPESGIAEYIIYRCDREQVDNCEDLEQGDERYGSVGTSGTNSFSDNSVSIFEFYQYRVSAVNEDGTEGTWSEFLNVVTGI